MESDPVQVNVLLSHDDNDDPCDMWINQNLGFNLITIKKIMAIFISRKIR
jgi:hypothetical protein